jgi:hypothetical protein
MTLLTRAASATACAAVAAALVTATALAASPAVAATPDTPPAGPVTLTNAGVGAQLSASPNGAADVQPQARDASGVWSLRQVGTGTNPKPYGPRQVEVAELVSEQTGGCLTADGLWQGSALRVAGCDAGDARQRFVFFPVDDGFTIRPEQAGTLGLTLANQGWNGSDLVLRTAEFGTPPVVPASYVWQIDPAR